MKKQIASFDIGAKNLAICVLNEKKEILFWKVINTLGSDSHQCCAVIKKSQNICKKKATFCVENTTFVQKESSIFHSENTTLVQKESSETIVDSLNQNEPETKSKESKESEKEQTDGKDQIIKDQIIEKEQRWYCRVHDPLKKQRTATELKKAKLAIDGKKVKSCTTQELNCKMIQALDQIDYNFSDLTEVIIELQPRFNPKMKQLSQTLYSYFLIRWMIDKPTSSLKSVKFVAAKNKLKIAGKLYTGPELECKFTNVYKRRKWFSQVYTRWILKDRPDDIKVLDDRAGKEDDLCDCYLQGLWYLNTF